MPVLLDLDVSTLLMTWRERQVWFIVPIRYLLETPPSVMAELYSNVVGRLLVRSREASLSCANRF